MLRFFMQLSNDSKHFLRICFTVLAFAHVQLAAAQFVGSNGKTQPLEFSPAIVPNYTLQANQIRLDGLNAVRKQLPHQTASIPASWRLVNVVPRNKTGAAQSEYLMFFQDEKTRSIYTISIDEAGMINTQASFKLNAQ